MRTRSFFWKVFLATVVIVAVTALFIGSQVESVVVGQRMAVISARSLDEATVLAGALTEPVRRWATSDGGARDPAREAIDAATADLATRLPGRRLTVVADDGTVLGDSHEDPGVMENHGDRPEIREPGLVSMRRSRTLQREMLYGAHPIFGADDRVLGYARVAVASTDVRAELSELRGATRNGALLAAAAGLVVAWVVSWQLTRRLRRVSDALSAMGRGTPRVHLPPAGEDEIGRLGRVVNDLSDQLADRMERLRESGEKDRAILTAMGEGVLAVDAEGRVSLVNGAAREMLDSRSQDPTGRPLTEVTRVPDVARAVEACQRTGAKVQVDVVVGRAGADRSLQVSVVPLGDEPGRGCVAVLHDITDLRRLETVRRDFVANVSHELKTPVTAIKGFVEAILDDERMDAEVRRGFLRRVAENADRLAAIISDLLALARIEAAHGQGVTREPIDLVEVVLAAVASCQHAADRKRIDLRTDLAEDSLPLRGDATALERAVTNLVDNAVKYSPEGSRVAVGVRRDERAAWVEVADQGPGIPARERERIFERFYRIHKDRSRSVGGTGLGLSIVKHAVAIHGGQVTVDSQVGHGSTFRIRLPLPVGPDDP